jgi:CHAT domain-containing protein
MLQLAVSIAQKNQDSFTEAAACGALGNTYLAEGEFEKAIASHQASLQIFTKLNNSSFKTTALNNLGNTYNSRYQRYLLQASSAKQEGDDKEEQKLRDLAQQDAIAAQSAYQQSVQESEALGGMLRTKALLNLARFLKQTHSPPTDLIANYRDQAMSILAKEPDSRAKAYSLINLAASVGDSQRQNQLEMSKATARNIQDYRAESFALTALGKVYEESGNLSQAMELTQQAQFAAQQVNAVDSLYRAQQQAGRIYKASGQSELAIQSYKQAIASLQNIRGDIAVASIDLQFDLRDSTEPVYRELMALLLEGSKEKGTVKNQSSPIQEALQVSELLQLSELQNFFGDECVQISRNSNNNKEKSNNTAIINSIILSDRTYMVLRLPNGSINSYPVEVSALELAKTIDRLRFTLENIATDEYLQATQEVYDLLIRPMAADLANAKPQTLVFVNDGVLRNVPMAALHDGKQFLIQKYAIASTLGLNLNSSQQQVKRNAKAVIFGLSVEKLPFAPLPNVKAETEGLQKLFGGKRFLDSDFTLANIQQKIEKDGYPIVHMATHAKFGADRNNTFLQLFDQRLSLDELEKVLRHSKQQIELLTLSACQTAAGDSRSTLGIAGVALRSGVQSTLASLWFVNDADTVPLIQDFYTQIRQPGVSKAEALRQAQLKIITDPNGHPAIWSPFVLVGNWQ